MAQPFPDDFDTDLFGMLETRLARALAQTQDNTTNSRIHVYFYHSGLYCFHQSEKHKLRTALHQLMSTFGSVTDEYYHAQFSYGFVEYANHGQAQAALDALKNDAELRRNISVVGGTDAEIAESLERLFVKRNGMGGLCGPSWAVPRR